MAKCDLTDCPANLADPPTPHALGDNECGYMNANDGPRMKMVDNQTVCRRPNCAKEFMTPHAARRHEADPDAHPKADQTFICDWAGHADALQDHGFCPVCQ